MAGRILQEDIEALKRRADLAEIVSDHTRLKRSGARLKGLCPFHQERTPSFTVDPGSGYYHCFGCNAGGDVYTFLEQIEGLTFVESVEAVARRVGYQLRYEELSAGQRRALGERSRLVAANEAAADFYHQLLLSPDGEVARTYLKERGFGRDEAERFRIGYAPLEWDALSRHLHEERFSQAELERSGLAVRNTRGGLRDRFRGRLLFPIVDLTGDVIGFGGRVLPGLDYGDHDPPKYLNTAETPLYHKQRVLYGMNWARPEIVRTGEVLVGEGYTDVIALHQAGFTNAVATCGTAVGEEHLRLLERYSQRVVLAFDSDAAGQQAAERAWELSKEHDVEVRVLVMPIGRDPADVVADGGVDAMRELVGRAEPVIRFMLRRATEGHEPTPEGRAGAIDAAVPHLATITDPVLRDQYVREVANWVGIGVGVVDEAVTRVAGGGPAVVTTRSDDRSDRQELSKRASLERDVLRVALQRPDLLPDLWSDVTEDHFGHPKAKAVLRALDAAGGPGAPLEQVLAVADDDDVRAVIRGVALEEFPVEWDHPKAAMSVAQLLLHRLDREIAHRKRELERLNPVVDPDAHQRGFEALIALEARRRDLREVTAG